MSRPHRGRFETWLRGGQTAHHTFDMTLEVLGWLSLIGAGWFLLCVLSALERQRRDAGARWTHALGLDLPADRRSASTDHQHQAD